MSDKITCPWCGREMELEHFGTDEDEYFVYICPDCAAQSPISYSAESALATALKRPLQKPMTLSEALDSMEPFVYIEHNNGKSHTFRIEAGYLFKWRFNKFALVVFDQDPGEPELHDSEDYGTLFRCWEHNPTEEECEAAEWERKSDG